MGESGRLKARESGGDQTRKPESSKEEARIKRTRGDGNEIS
jgi:hypothetical protein